MRKFKLIKEYPGSPKLGSIIKDTNPNNGAQDAWFSDNWGEVGNKGAFFISKSTCPENYPEFWEEVKEKEYEILEFKCQHDDRIIKLNSDGTYSSNGGLHVSLEEELKWAQEGLRYIYKIRRLSDGEVFSLGDRVQTTDKEFNGVIIKMEDYNNKILFHFKSDLDNTTIFIAQHLMQHYKEPIFTTEDGYECTLDDRVFGVCIKGSWEICEREVNSAILFLQNKHKEKSAWLYFKTKENRDKYIHENKPEFSRKQIKDRLKNWADRTVIDIILNDLEV